MITFDFQDRVALVTGASTGIGYCIAEKLLQAGGRVMLNASRQYSLDQALDRLGALREKAAGFRADVRVKTEVEAMFEAVRDRGGRLDILVNNAGVYPPSSVLEMTEEYWDRMLDTNLKGTFLCSQAAARQMIVQGQGGKIVNIASGAWKTSRLGGAAYSASKAGIVMFSAGLAQEVGPHHINVNVVAPGLVDVERRVMTEAVKARLETSLGLTPWGRMGKPEDVAHVVLMMCSPEADYVTGAVVDVDGGLNLGPYSIPMAK